MVKVGEKRKEPKKPMKKKPPKDYLLDNLWSRCIRWLAGNKCALCGNTWKVLHAHHWVGRRYKATRWLLDNGICLCFTCHQDIHDFPTFKRDVIAKTIGTDRLEQLEIIARSHDKPDKENVKAHLKEMLQGLEE